jgi:alpha-L-rhamnosidase
MKIYINHYSSSPIVDPENLIFGWVCESAELKGNQSSWEINLLQEEPVEKLVWNSTRVFSERSDGISYSGPRLSGASRYRIQILVTDQHGKSESGQRVFLTPPDAAELTGIWIGSDRTESGWLSEKRSLSARYMKKKLNLREAPRFAPFACSGLGLYELYVNHRKVGEDKMVPGLSHYDKRVYYNLYDLAPYLHCGENEIMVVLGNGRYFAPRLRTPIRTRSYGLPSLFCSGILHFPTDTEQKIQSDKSWEVCVKGPIVSNNEYDGEIHDARNEATMEEGPWETVTEMPPPAGKLRPQLFPTIGITEELEPMSVRTLSLGRYLVDFGQNIAGVCRLCISAEVGQLIELRYAERLDGEGNLYTKNLRSVEARDIYIAKGGGVECWEPTFTLHGFRYVEINAYPLEFVGNSMDVQSGSGGQISITALVIHDKLQISGCFTCNDELVNHIYRNIRWGLRGNYRSIPTDCPQRDERQGWLGDRAFGSRGETFFYDVYPLYRKWLDDMADSQLENGLFPSVAPPYWDIRPLELTWSGTYMLIAQMLVEIYGDTGLIRECFASAKRYLNYHYDNLEENGLTYRDDYGDWCMPPESEELIHSKDPNRATPPELLATSWLYYLTGLFSDWAEKLGETTDTQLYRERKGALKKAFTTHLFDPQRGCFGNGSVTSQILPLAFGLADPEQIKRAKSWLKNEIKTTYNSHVASGLVGMQWFYRTLSELGFTNLATETLLNRDFPSLGYMIEQGATTIWELWNGDTADPAMNSGNHVMLVGDLHIWLFEYLAGIRLEKPAYREFLLKPVIPEKLDTVEASLSTRHGQITSSWIKRKGELIWTFTIPFNTRARVIIPGSGPFTITKSDTTVKIANVDGSIASSEQKSVADSRTLLLTDGSWKITIQY